jgi:hypothetical protein
MARPRRPRPARPLFGYRDLGPDARESRGAAVRAGINLGVLVVCSLAWTLTVYFLEPGLR